MYDEPWDRPRRRGPNPFLVLALIGLLVVAILVAVKADRGQNQSAPYDDYTQYGQMELPETTIPRAPLAPERELELTEATGPELSYQAIYERVNPAVVSILGEGTGAGSLGTGIILSEDGYILTNYHVIEGCAKAAVTTWDDREWEAMLVGGDAQTDLAVLKVEAEDLTPAVFGRSDRVRVGDGVVAIGNPLGTRLRGTMTDGIISAINRNISVEGRRMTLMQTNAALNNGNSGGALVDLYGQVIGVTNMKMKATGYGTAAVEGLGFAIPSDQVKEVVDQLLQYGEVRGRASIGVQVTTLTAQAAEYYGLVEGAWVTEVTKGSDALEQGVQPGDVITAFNGRPVRDLDDLYAAKEGLRVGDSVVLELYREGETLEIRITLVDALELE